MARQLTAPVVILSTSGTAAANFLPAVVEARLSRIPLIVLTADRPPELRDWGAAQTIDQIHLFGSHVKWFVDMPVPDGDVALARHARATAARAVQTARSDPAGPIHLNFPFREPLLPGGPGANSATVAGRRAKSLKRSPLERDRATGSRLGSGRRACLADCAGATRDHRLRT